MIAPRFTEAQLQALMALASAGYESINLAVQAALIEDEQPKNEEPDDG